MQTFMPFPDFQKSLSCLDNKRLGKQRVEAMQILNVLDPNYDKKGWRNHPAVLMWKGYEEALKWYHNIAINLWIKRGFKNTMKLKNVGSVVLPHWMGDEEFHKSHQSNLLRKNEDHYNKYFNIPNNLDYVWPVRKI